MNQPMKGPMDVAAAGEPIVTAIVPRTFILTVADGTPVRVPGGIHEMPESIASHFYSKANGVTIYVPAKPPKAEKLVVARTLDDESAAKDADSARPVLSVKK